MVRVPRLILTIVLLGNLPLQVWSSHKRLLDRDQSTEQVQQALKSVDLPAPNRAVLRAIREMPYGGGYSQKDPAAAIHFRNAVEFKPGLGLSVQATGATPSFCSSATYLVFLKALNSQLTPEQRRNAQLKELRPGKQADGEGAWGRWNANSSGTGVFFKETGMGKSVDSVRAAKPGDFLKIFWKSSKSAGGDGEHGHSVVFLGRTNDSIFIWSSNTGTGYSVKEIPLTEIKHMIFSRMTHPENALSARAQAVYGSSNQYLKSAISQGSSFDEASRQAGIVGSE